MTIITIPQLQTNDHSALTSYSAAGTLTEKIPVDLSYGQYRAFNRAKEAAIPTKAVISAIPELFCDLSSRVILTPLSKAGIRSMPELLKSATTYIKGCTPAELLEFLPKPVQIHLVKLFFEKYEVRRAATQGLRRVSRTVNRGKSHVVLSNADTKLLIVGLSHLYVFVTIKLCSIHGLPYAKHGSSIVEYLMFGKALRVPLVIKTLISKRAIKESQTHKDQPTQLKSIVDLTVKDFKNTNAHALVEALPVMLKAYVKEQIEKSGVKDKSKRAVPERERNWNLKFRIKQRQKVKVESKEKEILSELKELLPKDIWTFLTLKIPAINSKSDSKGILRLGRRRVIEERRVAAALKSSIAGLKLRPSGSASSVAKMADYTRRLTESKAKLEVVQKELEDYKLSILAEQVEPKSWMVPYLDYGVSLVTKAGTKLNVKFDDGFLMHRLVERANSAKIKLGDPELGVKLNEAQASLLNYKGLNTLIKLFDNNTVKMFKTVFSLCPDVVKSKVLTRAIILAFGSGLDTVTGKVTSAKLLSLNNITEEDSASISKQYADSIKSWNPTKTQASELVEVIGASKVTAAAQYTVTKSSPAQLAGYRKDTPSYMSNLHAVGVRIMKSWEVEPSPVIAALLKQDQKGIKIIKNVFHGTSKQSGSVILHCGFKIRGTQVTARSMGDVLYVAPCIDKSAQYLKAGGGFTRSAGTTGIIFMGDILVAGEPRHSARLGKVSKFGWTKTGSFATEEIGLLHPNSQFVIRRVFMVKVERRSTTGSGGPGGVRNRNAGRMSSPANRITSPRAKFEPPVDITPADKF